MKECILQRKQAVHNYDINVVAAYAGTDGDLPDKSIKL